MALPTNVQFIGYVTRVGFNREFSAVFFPTAWTITMEPGDGLPVEGVVDVIDVSFPATEAEIVAGIKARLAVHLTEVFGEAVSVDQIIGCYPA